MLFSAHHDANLYLSVTVSARVTFIVFFKVSLQIALEFVSLLRRLRTKGSKLVLTYTFYIWALFIFIFIETYFHNHHRSCFNHFKIAFYLYIKYILSNHLWWQIHCYMTSVYNFDINHILCKHLFHMHNHVFITIILCELNHKYPCILQRTYIYMLLYQSKIIQSQIRWEMSNFSLFSFPKPTLELSFRYLFCH